jgi:prophage maintenance system killer protein/prophage antirepressor-like protein
MNKKQEIAIFTANGKDIKLNVDYSNENFWVTQAQMTEIFDTDVSGISRHIKNILKDGEVDEETNLQKMQIGSTTRPTTFYSLDIVLAVGYRVNSSKAIEFRQWATGTLKTFITKGYVINQKRMDELNLMLNILERSDTPEISGISNIMAEYTEALLLLEGYDEHSLPHVEGTTDTWILTYVEARQFLDEIKTSELFAKERTGQFKGILEQIYQGFGDSEFYPTVEEKAANLLYFIVKDHPFYDGNKRSAAALFVYFLHKNHALQNISNNTLAAIVLMVALSKPDERENMILLIRNFLQTK